VSSFDWRSLKDHRDNIQLAEIAALLHDWQKCIDMKIASHWKYNPPLATKATAWLQRKDVKPGEFSKALQDISLTLSPNPPIDLKTLTEEGVNPTSAGKHPHPLVRLLGLCHGVAGGVEKDLNESDMAEGSTDMVSSAFGFEHLGPESPFEKLLASVRPYLQAWQADSRSLLLDAVKRLFSEVWGDTRRPVNEVTLWDSSYTVASLFKSELAHQMIANNWQRETDLRWRLLRINFDILDLYSHAIKIADLLGYKKAIDDACESVKHLLEFEYPLGNKIYHDTTGIYFTCPDLRLDDDLQKEIRKRVEGIEPDLAPRIVVGPDPGLDGGQLRRLLADQHNKARGELRSPFVPANLSSCWQERWENLPDGAWEVCPVCRLRPKREVEEVCEHCKKRRESRIGGWLADPKTTIWLDELADENGRIALIVGTFGLDDWLSGDLVQTMLVKCDPMKKAFVPKNPSPARLRRVWETCQKFWENTASAIFRDRLPDRTRWELLPGHPAGMAELPDDKVCDGKLNGKPISVLRIGDHLLTVSYIPPKEPPHSGTLRVSWEGRRQKESVELDITGAREANGDLARFEKYRPTLTLLTSPDRFMALLPASDAVDLAERIRDAYTLEYGKVQNRLPMFLGLIFFPRKIPLFAVMDTARSMLDQVELGEETWHVSGVQGDCVSFKNGYSWCVPQKMGDGTTEDIWYPYFFVEGDASVCRRQFRLADVQTSEVVKQKYKDRWLLHVSELSDHTNVIVNPSRFSFVFLENSAQRFEFCAPQDVMYLDELSRLVAMWKGIRRTPQMTDTNLRGVVGLLQEKEDWNYESPEFRHLAETTLKAAGLWDIQGGVVTPDDVVSRRFERCLELYLHILKQRVKEEGNG
jgi:hypothetical protein